MFSQERHSCSEGWALGLGIQGFLVQSQLNQMCSFLEKYDGR